MDVSVILCTYNRAHLLGNALTALAAQRVAPDVKWELIVVDNNCTDPSKQLITDFQRSAPIAVTYVFEPQQGHTHARNAGVQAASGWLLAFTDDDCRPDPTWVQDVLDAIKRSDADGLGGPILPAWACQPPHWLNRERHLWDTLALLDDTEFRRVSLGPWEREHGIRVWGANMAFRRTVFDVVGRFDPALGPRGTKKFSHGDIEFVRRVLMAGISVVFDPTPVVRHWIGEDRMRRAFFRWHSFYFGEGYARKYGRPFSRHVLGIPPYLLRALAIDGFQWVKAVIRGDPSVFDRERQALEDLGSLWGFMASCVANGPYVQLRKVRSEATRS